MADPVVALRNSFTQPYASGNLPLETRETHRQATCPSACTTAAFGEESITGFQNVNSDIYQLHPGDEVQTHCFYNTENANPASQPSGNVQFGVATGQEMCMTFVFYYPVKYVNDLPWSLCGMYYNSGATPPVQTMCGSIDQAGGAAFMTTPQYGGQVSRPASRSYADPSGFLGA